MSRARAWAAPLLAMLGVATVNSTSAQSAADFERLLKASGYLESLKASAAVAQRAFAARGQGSDADFAKFMGIVASADLAPAVPCVVDVMRTAPLSKPDVDRLVAFYESPLGIKLRKEADRVMARTLATGEPQKPDLSRVLSSEEARQLTAVYQESSFQQYTRFTTNPEKSRAVFACLQKLEAVQRSGLKLD